MNNQTFHTLVASRTLALLDEKKARLYPEQVAFYVWPREGRVVVIFDTNMIDIGKVNADFAHRLSTRLQGRRVVRTNTRGLFLQVGQEIPPVLADLSAMPLDLSQQPTPYDLPVGSTRSGTALWVSLLEGDSFLVAGSRGMGKTGWLHGVIQALLHGGQTLVYAFDGKRGVEFSRYTGQAMFQMVTNLSATLADLTALALERRRALLSSGQPNLSLYNAAHPQEPMQPIAIVVDEAALTSDEEKAALVKIVERERDTGFHPIIGTNRPEASALLMKSNLVTRISFAVPSWNASQMALGVNGAETLDKVQGRGLIVFKARMMEFQSFRVMYPAPSEEAVRQVLEAQAEAAAQAEAPDERTRIVELAEQGKSISAIIRSIWNITGGGKYGEKADLVREVLAKSGTSSSSTTSNLPKNGLLEAV